MTWEDQSSYGRGERGVVEPTAWALRAGRVRVVVHRHIHYDPDVWLLTCDAASFDNYELDAKEVSAAQTEALGLVAGRLEENLREVRKMVG